MDNGCTVVAEVPSVSATLPETESGRSKMAECKEPLLVLVRLLNWASFDPFKMQCLLSKGNQKG